jgi:hypothetical protein
MPRNPHSSQVEFQILVVRNVAFAGTSVGLGGSNVCGRTTPRRFRKLQENIILDEAF